MSDVVQLCNMAIGRIGSSRFISAITEASNEAIVCNKFFAPCRDRCLSDFDWGFARVYADLQEITSTVPPGWFYLFRYPADCIKARRVIDPDFVEYYNLEPREPFEIISDGDNGLAIAANIETPQLIYTKRITNTGLWPEDFGSAFAWLLASEIAAPLASKPEYAKTCFDAYFQALLRAGASAQNEEQSKKQPDSEFISERL